MEQATRSPLMPLVADYMRDNPHVADRTDDSFYFCNFKLREPKDGSEALQLGNWTELLTEEQANVVPPACSKDNRDDGLFHPELAPDEEATSDIRLAVLDVKQWPILVYINFMGKQFISSRKKIFF